MPDIATKNRHSDMVQIQKTKIRLGISESDFRSILAETTGYKYLYYLDDRGRHDVLEHLKSLGFS
jgi:hypothetical protein